ncbi:RdRP-domain-containing protein [Choiromyces venosus 120613-1]|uniref:RNA-dependent RNA polymerase n=1 Tax=Choiromyces venosus 120613-1 TaxID=1336337 RepID=A0A3N4JK63_9PEZI|nr:RdRP-domain-containing protein [Choiromyces venosus 120613-1]
MEIFIQNIPYSSGRDSQLKRALEPHLNDLGVLAFRAMVFKPRPDKGSWKNGALTVPTNEAGGKFLNLYGSRIGAPPRKQIKMQGQSLRFLVSNKPCDQYVVKSLQKEQGTLVKESMQQPQIQRTRPPGKKFDIEKVECGVWSTEAEGSVPIFDCYYSIDVVGTLRFGGRAVHAVFETEGDTSQDDPLSLEFEKLGLGLMDDGGSADKSIVARYIDMISIVVSKGNTKSVTFTLDQAPRFFEETPLSHEFFFGHYAKDIRKRVSSLGASHALYAPFAFVYRIYLKDGHDIDSVMLLGESRGIPPVVEKRTSVRFAATEFQESSEKLVGKLQRQFAGPGMFPIAFQLNVLFAGGYLPPSSVLKLLPQVGSFITKYGCKQAATILQEFTTNISREDPTNEPGLLSHQALASGLNEFATSALNRKGSLIASRLERAQEKHMALVHHASITPAGCYFFGPLPEPQNRVLRKYPDHHEYFIRVTFCEEDGDQLLFQHKVDQSPIYNKQFRFYLSAGVTIAGRKYEFLGFSSSSLRTQSCWFMAPFWVDGEYLNPQIVTSKLGDFSRITCPGRYAARVGQAFSDTYGSIDVKADHEVEIPDVQRDGRTFSDGVGTISQKLLNRVWGESEALRKTRPTVFQIRFAGAKGVVSLDTRLDGDQFCLRPSMIKFRGSTDRKIEICNSADRLPMFLNRPLIKVLEDIGVAESTFMTLQKDAIEELRNSTTSAANAANFLKRQRIASTAVRLPWVIESLNNLGFNFRDDHFLEQAFELSLITSLRNLKHKARIPVKKGMTLIGVMDETGYLEEGQIYVTVQGPNKSVSESIAGRVLITRSPVHHPGDVQMALAIGTNQLPADSPLRALRNCVAFSQQGSRDMPSMLSVQDLYNIIYDARFTLKTTHAPAEYPRVPPKDLGRPVVTSDIVDFFLEFMENNLLGMISTRHLITADKKVQGVHHPDCLKLAELASTAVDFPKTGIKVSKSDFPKATFSRPDFMAPGPRILIKREPEFVEEQAVPDDDDDDEDTPITYYESEKVLGKLYREIDETAFLREVQGTVHRERRERNVDEGAVVLGVWEWLEEVIPSSYKWENYIGVAVELKEAYEREVERMMVNYSDMPWKHRLREVEVFIGCIVGKERQTQKQKDNSASMKSEFDRLASCIVESMQGESREETLGIGMASLSLCLPEKIWKDLDSLKSFAWVAISVLLTEVDKMQKEVKSKGIRGVRGARR